MWFGNNTKKIKLSRKLNWSVGKAQHTNLYFWFIGSFCFVLACVLIVRTNVKLQTNPTPEVLGAATHPEVQAETISLNSYTVSKGETLFSISQKFGIPIETLAQLNDMKTPFNIQAGQVLKVPIQ